MHNNIREVVVCVLNLAIVLLVAFSNRASESYQMFKTFDNIFNEGLTEKSLTSTRQAFHKVLLVVIISIITITTVHKNVNVCNVLYCICSYIFASLS